MSRRRVFGSLLGLVFLVNLARIVFAPLLEPLMATYEVGPGPAGIVATLVWLGSASPRLPVGYLLTHFQRHHVILAAGGVLTIAAIGTAFAPTIELVGGGAFLMGLSSGMYFIAANPLVSELFPDNVGRALGIHGMGNQLAAVVAAPFVGAVLLLDGYRGVFLSIGAAAFIVTTLLFVIARQASLPAAGVEDRDLLAAIKAQWPLIVTGVFILGTAGFVWNGVFNFYVTYLRIEKAITVEAARDFLTVVFAAGVPAFWFTGRLADRFPRIPLMLTIIGGFAIALLVLPRVDGFVGLLSISIVIGFLIHGLFPVIDTYMLDGLPDHNRASAYSAYSAAMMLFQALGSSVVGTLIGAGISFDAVFGRFGMGLAGIIVLLGILYAFDRLPRGR